MQSLISTKELHMFYIIVSCLLVSLCSLIYNPTLFFSCSYGVLIDNSILWGKHIHVTTESTFELSFFSLKIVYCSSRFFFPSKLYIAQVDLKTYQVVLYVGVLTMKIKIFKVETKVVLIHEYI